VEGVLGVDKPIGWTSHDAVAACRRAFGIRRIGHGGTLDPLATGVLPILVGRATRFVERLHTALKVYGAIIAFGHETTTGDREGEVAREAPVPILTATAIDEALGRFRGEITQVPPAYAAVKVGGRRAYDRARGGETFVLPPRRVRVERVAIASWEPPGRLRLVVVCSGGTYIRSLARDIGIALGSAAHLAALVRLAVGAFELEEAVAIQAVREGDAGALGARLRDPSDDLLRLDARFQAVGADRLLAGWEG
jgi:tRNA pseudouridine55 synthase